MRLLTQGGIELLHRMELIAPRLGGQAMHNDLTRISLELQWLDSDPDLLRGCRGAGEGPLGCRRPQHDGRRRPLRFLRVGDRTCNEARSRRWPCPTLGPIWVTAFIFAVFTLYGCGAVPGAYPGNGLATPPRLMAAWM